jgi:predicted DNA-binding transcriptional regulator AlpA
MPIDTCKEEVPRAPNLEIDSLMRDRAVQKATGIGKTKRAEMMSKGEFPSSIKIFGGRTNYWLASEIERFIANQVARYRAEQAEKLAQLTSDPFNVLLNNFVKKPKQQQATSQESSDA